MRWQQVCHVDLVAANISGRSLRSLLGNVNIIRFCSLSDFSALVPSHAGYRHDGISSGWIFLVSFLGVGGWGRRGGRWAVFITGPRISHLNWVTLYWSTMTNFPSVTHCSLCHDSLDFCNSVLGLPRHDITRVRKDAELWLAGSSGRDSVTQSDTEAETFDVLTKKKKKRKVSTYIL